MITGPFLLTYPPSVDVKPFLSISSAPLVVIVEHFIVFTIFVPGVLSFFFFPMSMVTSPFFFTADIGLNFSPRFLPLVEVMSSRSDFCRVFDSIPFLVHPIASVSLPL